MLNQEVVAYKQFGTLLSRQKFAIIDDQRVALSMDAEGLELLAQSEATIRTEEQAKAASQRRVLNRPRLFFIAAIFALLFAIIAAVPTIQDRLRRREARSLSTLMYIARVPLHPLVMQCSIVLDWPCPKGSMRYPALRLKIGRFQLSGIYFVSNRKRVVGQMWLRNNTKHRSVGITQLRM